MLILGISWVQDIIERNHEVVQEETEEVEDQEFIEEELREGNVDEDDDVVLENKHKGGIMRIQENWMEE